MGMGALVGGNWIEKVKDKVRVYIIIEILIGFIGIISLSVFTSIGNYIIPEYKIIGILLFVFFMSLPTLLMGSTLPILVKILSEKNPDFSGNVSSLYALNTLGAALGTLVSSYIFISLWGLDTAVYIACGLNLGIGLLILLNKHPNQQVEVVEITGTNNNSYIKWYSIFFITGFMAMAYEILWFRMIGVIVKASTYAFSSILFVYLLGIATGSWLGNKWMKKMKPQSLFYILQIVIATYVLLSLVALCSLKYFPTLHELQLISFKKVLHPDSWYGIDYKSIFLSLDIFIWPFFFVFIPTLLMGASFPVMGSILYQQKLEGKLMGEIYFFNVLGNIIGILITGLFLLHKIGTEKTLLLLVLTGFCFLFLLKIKRIYQAAIFTCLIILTWLFFPKNQQIYASIHPEKVYSEHEQKRIDEGTEGIVASFEHQGKLTLYINGMKHGGRPHPAFYYEAIEALAHSKFSNNILMIGLGTGSTLETILKSQPNAKITLVELNELVIDNLSNIPYLKKMIENEQVNIIIDDGRTFLLRNKIRYDAIYIDPLRSTTAYGNNVFSQEFFTLIQEDLTKEGIFMLWTDEYHIIPKTLCSVFPCVKQYSFFCLASSSELLLNETKKANYAGHFPDFIKFFEEKDRLIPKSKSEILQANSGYPINTDLKPRTEYYLGLK